MKLKYFVLPIIIFLLACGDDELDSDLEISVPVSVQEVKLAKIEEFVTTTATVNAIKYITLRSEIDGKYKLAINPSTQRHYATGDQVKSGQVIVLIENSEHENNIKIESQKLNLDISKREFEKSKSLYEKGGVTLLELKNAERSFMDAQYNYDNAKIQIEKLKIPAPFNGIIVDLPYYPDGLKIEMNQTIVQLMDYSQLYAEVQFPVNELDRIIVNQEIRVTHYNLPGDTLNGNITQVSPTLDPETRSFKSSILINNKKQTLRPGMFAKVETIVASKDSVIVIPKEIILSKRKGKTVYIVEKGSAIERTISTGLENTENVEVLEGLKVSERLITKGFETLRNHSKVKIVR
ncbi:efflux RND transporter periplasmic adaptor subunit [Calditrichota bacterium]